MAHKGISAEMVHVSLLDGESESEVHRARNPLGYVPVLERLDTGELLTESLPIIEWLDESFPGPKLLPSDPWLRGRTRALAETINAGTQPLQNLTVALHLSSDPAVQKTWNQHWIKNGLQAFEILSKTFSGPFSAGDALTLADLCLIPQIYAARRNEVDLAPYAKIRSVVAHCEGLDSYRGSEPSRYEPKSS